MEIEDKVLIERERIRTFIESKFESEIKEREKIRNKRRRNISLLEDIRHYLLFKLDNPDYVRLKDRTSGAISL